MTLLTKEENKDEETVARRYKMSISGVAEVKMEMRMCCCVGMKAMVEGVSVYRGINR